MTSPDLVAGNIEKLAALFPHVVTESADANGEIARAIDFDLLRQELSDHLVEGPQERFRLEWPGKRAATLTANAPIAKTLRPVREDSVNFDTTENLFIEGDNLEALKLLQESYLGKVKVIYIDPPYNTGHDFVYNDDFAESTEEYLKRSGQVTDEGERLVTNPESNGRFHSDWLSMIYPRLRLARNLLADDGLLFVSIGAGEADRLRQTASEIFGTSNLVGDFVWKKGGTGKNDSQFAVVEHEYLFAFARDAQKASFGIDTGAKVSTSYNLSDEKGQYSLVRLDSKTLGYQKSLDYAIVDPEGVEYFPEQPSGKQEIARWRWSKKKTEDNYDELVFRNGFVYTKNYKKKGARPRSLLSGERFGVTRSGKADAEAVMGQSGIFDFPKPVRLIKFLIEISSGDGDIVMDFFAGSSTTAHAVMELNAEDGGNRKFVMVQISEETSEKSATRAAGYATISELSRERIRRAGRKIEQDFAKQLDERERPLDVGFRSLRIDSSNMNDVLATPDEVSQPNLFDSVSNVKADRTGEDLLFQVLLDWGLPLDVAIEVESIEGQECFVVEGGALIACFEPSVNAETVRVIAKREPVRAVFRDEGFASDAERINAEQIFKEFAPFADVKVI